MARRSLLPRRCAAAVVVLLASSSAFHPTRALSAINAKNAPLAAAAGGERGYDDDGRRDRRPGRRRPRVVVIGAGVGGLATAARIKSGLPRSAVDVVVLERNPRGGRGAGGRCGGFDVRVHGVGTFRHERGPSLLLLRGEYERLFADCGVRDRVVAGGDSDGGAAAVAYGLEMRQCVPAYHVVFEDGDVIPLGFPRSICSLGLSPDEVNAIRTLELESIRKFDSLETDGHRKWREYLDTCAAYLDCGLPNFIGNRLDVSSLPNFLFESLREGGKRWPLSPHSTMLSSLFDSAKLTALASFQDLYVGLEPYEDAGRFGGGVLRKTAPAVFGLLAGLELLLRHGRRAKGLRGAESVGGGGYLNYLGPTPLTNLYTAL